MMQSAEMRLCDDPTDTLNFARDRWLVDHKCPSCKPPDECLAIGTVAIMHDIIRRSLPAVSLRQSSSNPFNRPVLLPSPAAT